MFEKLKDLLYETSDILLALVIILLMSTVITWKVTDSLAYTREKGSIFTEIEQQSDEDPSTKDNAVPDNQEIIAIGSTPEESGQTTVVDTQDDSPSEQNTPQIQPAPEPVQTAPSKPAPAASAVIRVEIPSGTSGAGIAKILKDKGLIDHTAKFVARVEELKLASKLKSDTFDIPSGTPLDDIIYIITGTKR